VRMTPENSIANYLIGSHKLRCRNGLQPVAEIISLDRKWVGVKVASSFERGADDEYAGNSPLQCEEVRRREIS
jgi:hypothetical protein